MLHLRAKRTGKTLGTTISGQAAGAWERALTWKVGERPAVPQLLLDNPWVSITKMGIIVPKGIVAGMNISI